MKFPDCLNVKIIRFAGGRKTFEETNTRNKREKEETDSLTVAKKRRYF